MMKKIFLLFSIICLSLPTWGNPVSVDEARQKAMGFLSQGNARHVKGNRSVELAYTMMPKQVKVVNDNPVLYAFNISGDGFVIVSGDDATPAILGHGDKGHFNTDSIPCGMRLWLDMCAKQVLLKRQQGENAPVKAPTATANDRIDIPILIDVEWDQGEPYNDQCIFDGVRCMTGCVATAMAQVAYYWGKGKNGRHFQHGCDALDSYVNYKGMKIPALPAVASFDWDAMTMTDGQPNTQAAKAAVAQLMRYCGQVAQIEYGPYESPGYTDYGLYFNDHFGYASDIEFSGFWDSEQDCEDLEKLNQTMYSELRKGNPVIMGGGYWRKKDNPDPDHDFAGHAFVCDGYDATEDRFHINWGWGGSFNGYFWLDLLAPEAEGLPREDIIIDGEDPGNGDDPIVGVILWCNFFATEGVSPWVAYKERSGNQLVYYYDGEKDTREGTIYSMSETPNRYEITKVVFDESFSDYWCMNDDACFESFMVEKYEGLENLNVSGLTSMKYMFYDNSSLKQLDLSSFNTSNVKNMRYMFRNCSSLESLDVSHFDTSNVTDMRYMFYGCRSLTSLDLSGFFISENTNTSYVLGLMGNLTSLSISQTMHRLNENACWGTGTPQTPCVIYAPEGFDFGTETDGPYFEWKSGYFRLPGSFVLGDVNHDAGVDVYDVTALIDLILEGDTNAPYRFTQYDHKLADVNIDGSIDIYDVTMLIDLILAK